MNPDELVDHLVERDSLTAEAKAVIARTVKTELEPLIRQICREELSALLKKLRERIKNARAKDDRVPHPEPISPVVADDKGPVEEMACEQEAPVSLECHTGGIVSDPKIRLIGDEPSDYLPPIEAKPKERHCRCCGSLYTKTGQRQSCCPDCAGAKQGSRNRAIVHALWQDYPEIAEALVAKLKDEGGWPE